MRKTIVAILMTMMCLTIKGQDVQQTPEKYSYYCVYYGVLQLSGKVKPEKMIWGDEKKEVKLTDKTGTAIKFNNMVDVTNYMSKRGWKYKDCEVYHNNWFVVYEKYVSNDDEAKEGLYFDIDFNN